MNKNAVAAAVEPWRTLHAQLKVPLLTGKDIGILSHKKETLRHNLATAYAAAPEESSAVPQTDIDDDDEERTTGKLLDYYCIPASPAAKALAEAAWGRWLAYQQRLWNGQPWKRPAASDLLDYKLILDTVLANILNADLSGHDQVGIRVSRDQARLQTLSRYRPQLFNRRLLTVLDSLAETGLIQQVKGRKWSGNIRPASGSKLTELRSTRTLRTLMEEWAVSDIRDVKFERTGQEIVLLKKDKAGNLAEYLDTDIHANLYRAQLRGINTMLHRANLTVLNRPGLPFVDDRDRFLQRQFTYQSWTSGGRLKGGFWMPMSKVDRHARILINGEETVELDYNSIPMHCLYSKAKATLSPGDIYTIPGLDQKSRAGIKVLLLALTFDKKANRRTFPRKDGLSSLLFTKVDQEKGCRHAITQIKAHHSAVGHLLGADQGHGLQFQESQVLITVLLKIAQLGLVGLPIHDCLLVPLSQADHIQDIMETCASEVLGLSVPVKRQ